jgi:caffeoyl-CoA O-methyltransferase
MRSMLVSMATAVVALAGAAACAQSAPPADGGGAGSPGSTVQRFLEERRGTWHDLNVPEADGKALHDVIVERGAKRVVEIGTSTGLSGTWMAWALSKTGGRLVTLEIDPGRHREAQANFKAAGIDAFVDARLGDAHELVPKLDAPIDMAFIDADKDWYTNYAKALIPKLSPGGCLLAHNVNPRGGYQMTGDYYEYVTGLPEFETAFRAGVMVSCKKATAPTR